MANEKELKESKAPPESIRLEDAKRDYEMRKNPIPFQRLKHEDMYLRVKVKYKDLSSWLKVAVIMGWVFLIELVLTFLYGFLVGLGVLA